MKRTLLICRFETGDMKAPYWNEMAILEGEISKNELDDTFSSYFNRFNYNEDEDYEVSFENILNSMGDIYWEPIKNGEINCNNVVILDI